jgi:hypothetical protein
MQSELDGATAKPLLRGVSHEFAALAALVGWAAVAATAPTKAAPVPGHSPVITVITSENG